MPSPVRADEDAQAEWKTTGSLQIPREGHTATLLRNGQVLIVGGANGYRVLASAELYDPKEGAFTSSGELHSGRTNHTATLLPNGQVLVAGGQVDGKTLTSAELYNPKTGVWTPTGDLNFPRSYHTATLLKNGQVLVAGGSYLGTPMCLPQGTPAGSAMDCAELYDPASGKWTVTGGLFAARYVHTATLLQNGKVLVTGGIGVDGAGGILVSAEVYDPAARTWTSTANLINPLLSHTATLLPDGKVLVAGGKPSVDSDTAEAELYDPKSDTWTATKKLHILRNAHTATSLPNGQILVVGGASSSGDLNSAELYDPAKGTWTTVASLHSGHVLHTATLLPDGRVLVVGGLRELGSPDFVEANSELYKPLHASASTPKPESAVKSPFD